MPGPGYRLPKELYEDAVETRQEDWLGTITSDIDRTVKQGWSGLESVAGGIAEQITPRTSPIMEALQGGGLQVPTLDDLTPDWVKESTQRATQAASSLANGIQIPSLEDLTPESMRPKPAAGTTPVVGATGQPVAMPTGAPTQTGDLRAYTRAKALSLGIDPDIAERVAMSEGGFDDPVRQSDVVNNGRRETSFGPFQLFVGGGLGDEAIKRGHDPRDPANIYRNIDFALETAAQKGWGDWHGAARVGIGPRQGIGVSAPTAAPAVPSPAARQPALTSGPVPAAQAPTSLTDITPAQFGLGDADAEAICGPVLMMAFARSNGRNPTIAEAKQIAAQNGGWTSAQGMGGPEATAQALRAMGVPATYQPGALDIDIIRRETQNGNPVGINTRGHYFVVEGVDAEGRLNLGNSAKALRASGGRQWFRPEEIPGLGMGAPTGAIYKDSPSSPTPSVAVAATGLPPVTPNAAGPATQAAALPPAPAGGPSPAGAPVRDDWRQGQVSPLDDARASTGGGPTMARQPLDDGVPVRDRWADEPQVPFNPDEGPREAPPGSVGASPAVYDSRTADEASSARELPIQPVAVPQVPMGVDDPGMQPTTRPNVQITQGGPPTPSAQWTPVETRPTPQPQQLPVWNSNGEVIGYRQADEPVNGPQEPVNPLQPGTIRPSDLPNAGQPLPEGRIDVPGRAIPQGGITVPQAVLDQTVPRAAQAVNPPDAPRYPTLLDPSLRAGQERAPWQDEQMATPPLPTLPGASGRTLTEATQAALRSPEQSISPISIYAALQELPFDVYATARRQLVSDAEARRIAGTDPLGPFRGIAEQFGVSLPSAETLNPEGRPASDVAAGLLISGALPDPADPAVALAFRGAGRAIGLGARGVQAAGRAIAPVAEAGVAATGRAARGLAEEGARQLMDLTPTPRIVPPGEARRTIGAGGVPMETPRRLWQMTEDEAVQWYEGQRGIKNEDMVPRPHKVVETADQLQETIAYYQQQGIPVFLRSTGNIRGDIKRGYSMNFQTGRPEGGLSANEIDPIHQDRGVLARILQSQDFYQHNVSGGKPPRLYLLTGDAVGRGGDNEHVLSAPTIRVLGEVRPDQELSTLGQIAARVAENRAGQNWPWYAQRNAIKDALERGDTVPTEVLARWPELAEKYPQAFVPRGEPPGAPIGRGGAAAGRDFVDRSVTRDVDVPSLVEDLTSAGAKVNDDGTVTVYHRTTPEAARQIEATGAFRGDEDGVFFSTRPDGQAAGYGDTVVAARVPVRDLMLDDVFVDEAHVRVPTVRAGVPYHGATLERAADDGVQMLGSGVVPRASGAQPTPAPPPTLGPVAQRVMDTYAEVTPKRVERITQRGIQVASDAIARKTRPGSMPTPPAELVAQVHEAVVRNLEDTKVVMTGLNPGALRAFLRGEGLTSKAETGDLALINAITQGQVNVAGGRLKITDGVRKKVPYTLEDAAGFAQRESEQMRAFTGGTRFPDPETGAVDADAPRILYAYVSEGQPLVAPNRPTLGLVWKPSTPRVSSVNHPFGAISRAQDIHVGMAEGNKALVYSPDAIRGARHAPAVMEGGRLVEAAPGVPHSGELAFDWERGGIDIGDGRKLADTDLMVGPDGESQLRATALVTGMTNDIQQAIARGEMTDPEQIAAVLMRGGSPQWKPGWGSVTNPTRTESLILDPHLQNVQAIYISGTQKNIASMLEGSRTGGPGGGKGERLTELEMARRMRAAIKAQTGEDVPILFTDTTRQAASEAQIAEGASNAGWAPSLISQAQVLEGPPLTLSPGRGRIVDQYTQAIDPTTGRPYMNIGSGVVPGLRADAFNAAQGGVFGAASEDLQAQQEGREPDPAERLRRGVVGAGLATAGGRYARRGAGQRLGSGVVPEPTRPPRTRGTSLPEDARPIKLTPDEEVKRLRLDKFPAEVRDLIEQSAGDQGFVHAQRRGVLPDDVVQQMAQDDAKSIDQLIKSGKAGKAYNAEETVAIRNATASQATVVRELSEEIAQARANKMTPDLLLARRAAEAVKLDGLVKLAEGARAEAGRTLRQYAAQAKLIELDPDAAIARIRRKISNPEEFAKVMDKYTQAVQEGADPIQMAKLWAKVENGKITKGDVFALFRRFNMLSGPRTIEVNLLSGATNVGHEIGSSTLGTLVRGRPEDAAAEIAAPFKASGRAFQNMAETLWHGVNAEQAARNDIPSALSMRTDNKAAKAALTTMEIPDRFNAAVDQFFRTMTEDWAATKVAYKQARADGLTPRSKNWNETVAAKLETIRDDPSKFPEIAEMANHVTFSDEPGTMGKSLETLKRDHPNTVGFVLPFIRTPYNIASKAVDISPLGVVRTAIEASTGVGRGRKNLSRRVRDNVLGVAGAYWAYNQAQQGNVTGAGPDDPEKLAQLRATGWRPYSIRFNNPMSGETEYWSYANFAPFSLALSSGAAAYEAQKYAKPGETDTLNLLGDAAKRTGKVVTDMTVLAGIGAVIKAQSDPERYGSQWLTTALTQLMPAGSLVNTIGQATDSAGERRAERDTFGNQVRGGLAARVPDVLAPVSPIGTRQDVPVARQPLGEPVPNNQQGMGALNPFRPSPSRPDRVYQAFTDAGVDIGAPPKTIQGQDAMGRSGPKTLTPAQQRQYQATLGQEVRQRIAPVLDSLSTLPREERQKRLQTVLQESREAAAEKFRAASGMRRAG